MERTRGRPCGSSAGPPRPAQKQGARVAQAHAQRGLGRYEEECAARPRDKATIFEMNVTFLMFLFSSFFQFLFAVLFENLETLTSWQVCAKKVRPFERLGLVP